MLSKSFPAASPVAELPRSVVHRAAMVAVLLSLSACLPGRGGAPSGPVPAAVEPEELGETPALVEEEARAPKRDILGDAAYDLPLEANSWVEAELDFLVEQRREVIQRWLQRGDPFEAYIKQELRTQGIPSDLYHLAMIESGFLPAARSRAGAVGLWQFMPATGRQMGLRVDSLVDERMDPVRSTRAAARHLRALHRIYGDWALAAAAYNAGSGRISRGMQRFEAHNFWELAAKGDLAAETKHYVPRLYAVTIIGRNRERFGFPARNGATSFAYDSIHVEYATPLEELAKMGEATREQLAQLNPHLVRGTTPAGGYWIWVPAGSGVALQRAYLTSEFRKQQGYGTYVVRSGDSLGRLAELAGVKSSRIRELNPGINFDKLQIGAKLKMPYQAAEKLTSRPVEPVADKPVVAKAESSRAEPAKGEAHTVQDGETLWAIARQYGVGVARIQEANGLADATIRPGQRLQIPRAAESAPAEAPRVEHVVQSGDSLWGIARKYGSSVDAIQAANQLGDRPIVPGQRLLIPR